MAMNSREAQRMLDRALESPRLTAMVVPSPYGLAGDDVHGASLIASGLIGKLREVHVHSLERSPCRYRSADGLAANDPLFGLQHATLGIVYESVLRRLAPAKRVLAYAFEVRFEGFDPEQGKKMRVGTPDSVQVLTTQRTAQLRVYRLQRRRQAWRIRWAWCSLRRARGP